MSNNVVNGISPSQVAADIQNCEAENGPVSHIADLFEDRITSKSNIKPIEPIVKIADANFASRGDFSVVGGLPKAGKTSVAAFLIATALMKNCEGRDTLSIRSEFCDGKPVFYFDTEQPPAFTDKLRKQVLNIMGVVEEPNNLFIINLRKYSYSEKQIRIFKWMESYPNAHLFIIDGIADLIRDPNDTKEAFGIIEQIYTLSSKLNTTIIGFIHENPGSAGKLRGNLGSEAERKCGGAITIKKHKEQKCHSIESRLIRGSADFEPIYFRYDPELHTPVSISDDESNAIRNSTDKKQKKRDRLIALARRVLITGSLSYTDLTKAILAVAVEIEGEGFNQRTAQNRIKDLKAAGIIELSNDFYALADIYKPQP